MTSPIARPQVSEISGPPHPTSAIRIDAHLHLWQLRTSDYSWLTPEHGPLHASFSPEQAEAELSAAGIGAAVLVQADDSEADTAYLLRVAQRHPWVAGVVGWVNLEHCERAAAQLERWSTHEAFCGVRQLIHDDPRADVLDLPEVRRTLRLIAERSVPLDVPDAWPRQLSAAARAAHDLPDLLLVLDHLGKPPRGTDDLAAWRDGLAAVAASERAVAKVSGLHRSGAAYSASALRPVWDAALELFGPARLMYGGDWPITVTTGGYQRTLDVLAELVGELSLSEQDDVWRGTAVRTYGLDVGAGGTS